MPDNKNEKDPTAKFTVDAYWPDGVDKPGTVGKRPEGQGVIISQDWQSLSRQLGLELYERQPEETDNEWLAWQTYREYYPGKLPTMSELSKKVHMTVATLLKYSQKWNWKVRMIHWVRATDADIMSERRDAIKEMNRKQLRIADTMMNKLVEAVDYLDPVTMKPAEITNMMKFVTGLQKDITTYTDEAVDQPALDASVVKQSQVTKKEDLSSVAEILASVGLLDGSKIGIKTTEVVISKEEENNG